MFPLLAPAFSDILQIIAVPCPEPHGDEPAIRKVVSAAPRRDVKPQTELETRLGRALLAGSIPAGATLTVALEDNARAIKHVERTP